MARPEASSEAALVRMKRMKRRDTRPELEIRSALHRQGFRFRVDHPILDRRRADLVFTRKRVAVFVDGCFWHGCPQHVTWPRQNSDWWREKILTNRRRDRDTDTRLEQAGWLVVRVWEHEDPDAAAKKIAAAVGVPR